MDMKHTPEQIAAGLSPRMKKAILEFKPTHFSTRRRFYMPPRGTFRDHLETRNALRRRELVDGEYSHVFANYIYWLSFAGEQVREILEREVLGTK